MAMCMAMEHALDFQAQLQAAGHTVLATVMSTQPCRVDTIHAVMQGVYRTLKGVYKIHDMGIEHSGPT